MGYKCVDNEFEGVIYKHMYKYAFLLISSIGTSNHVEYCWYPMSQVIFSTGIMDTSKDCDQ